MLVKSNCKNRVILEGYVHYKKYTASVDGKKKLVLKMYTINLARDGKTSYVAGPIKVVAYGNRADECNKFIKDDMLIEVEGRLRIPSGGHDWQIMAVYISEASPILKQITYEIDDISLADDTIADEDVI
jgi:hypothetical protein